jgi:hypothetical protein
VHSSAAFRFVGALWCAVAVGPMAGVVGEAQGMGAGGGGISFEGDTGSVKLSRLAAAGQPARGWSWQRARRVLPSGCSGVITCCWPARVRR